MTDEERTQVKVTNKRVLTDDAPETSGAGAPDDAAPLEDGAPSEADAARAEAAQYLDDLQRLKAEFENFRKRMVKEQTSLVERASAGVVERLLPVLDNFELALLAADRTKDYAAMVRGVELVYSELVEALKKEGLERIDALNEPFDPEKHEAVMHGEGDDEGDEVVVDEMRTGYRFAGRVIRPAMVKVARKKKQ